jgi:hypothetical protein
MDEGFGNALRAHPYAEPRTLTPCLVIIDPPPPRRGESARYGCPEPSAQEKRHSFVEGGLATAASWVPAGHPYRQAE